MKQIKNIKDLVSSMKPCKSCCNLYEFTTTVNFIKDSSLYAALNTDAADLLPFDDAGRTGANAVHYINWLMVDNENALNTNSLYTDCFRNRFTETSLSNRGELDLAGSSLTSAISWAKNFCTFVNNKFKKNNIFGKIYTNYEVTLSYPNSDEIQYNFKFYINLHKKHTLGNLQQARYDTLEFVTATDWEYSPTDDLHRYVPTFLQQIKCSYFKK